MQLYWLSPIVIFPLWWNWKAGLTWWAILYSLVTGIIAWVTKVCTKLPTPIFTGAAKFVGHEVNEKPDACNYQVFSSDFGPFIRAQPYLIGLLFGWVLYKLKGKKIKIPHVRFF